MAVDVLDVTTMDEMYGDGREHEACEECGLCIDCEDCICGGN